jgi:hypothetical protein
MSWFEVYAFFGTPLIVLGIGMLVYFIAARDAPREPLDRAPGE